MDLLEKIKFNRVIHQVMAQLHNPYLSHSDIQSIQASLHNLIAECSNKQINEQAQTLLQQIHTKSTALHYAEETKHLKNFVGTVTIPIELVELLTQNDGIGWGILSKNNNLWQIMLKYSKHVEHSVWVEHLSELTAWLDAQMDLASQISVEEKPAFGSSANKASEVQPIEQAVEAPDIGLDLPDFVADFEFNISPNSPSQNPLASLELDHARNLNALPSFDLGSPTTGNPFAAMRAELENNGAISNKTQSAIHAQSDTAIDFSQLELTTTGITAIPKVRVDKSHFQDGQHISAQQTLIETATQQAVAQLTPQQQLALTPDLVDRIATALADKLKPDATQTSQVAPNPVTLGQSFGQSIKSELQSVEQNRASEDHSITLDFNSFNTQPAMSIQNNALQDLARDISNISHSSQQILTQANNPTTNVPITTEAWECSFELGTELDHTYFYIHTPQQPSYLNLVTLNTDLAKIQRQPIYMVEIIDTRNQFKYYTFIFASESNIQAIQVINQLVNVHDYQMAHISQITWKEFKAHTHDLTLCCQLYHTSPVIMKSHSLYSHIAEQLISKQQMLYIEEVEADSSTPLLLLQENGRFRIIHGKNRLEIGAPFHMYPCMILCRTSGITWQIIREQLKYLPKKVNVYELFKALQQHAI